MLEIYQEERVKRQGGVVPAADIDESYG